MAGAVRGRGANGRSTMRDVAVRAGVSPQTVSNYLNRRHGTRPEIQRSIDQAMRELRYLPNASAKSLRSRRTQSIAVVLEDPNRLGLHDPLHLEFLHGATRAARAANHTVVLELTGRGETVTAALTLVRQGRVDGVLLSLGELRASDRNGVAEIVQHVPVVLLQQDDVVPGAHTVSAKDEQGAAQAVALVAAAGHRRIAWLGAEPLWPGPRRRLDGVRAACREARVELVEWEAAAYTAADARAAAAGRLTSTGSPTAVLAVNDLVALGVVQQAESEGLRVPDDVFVVGFNDFDFARWVRPAITTVRLPAARMGTRAAELVIASANEKDRSTESVRFDVELVERETTRHRGSEQR